MSKQRAKLESKFCRYQAILGDRATEHGEERINLMDIVHDYYVIDDDERITIKYVSKDEKEVFLTIQVDEKEPKTIDIAVPLCEITDFQLNSLVESMRKAMIIEELRSNC